MPSLRKLESTLRCLKADYSCMIWNKTTNQYSWKWKLTATTIQDMIFFDNQTNNTSCVAGMNGPTVVYTPDGVTRALFEVNYRSYRKEGRMTDLKWCRKGSLFFQRQERSWVQHPHGGDNLVRARFNCVYSASAAPLLIANYIICSWCDENSVPKDWNGYLSCNYFSCSRIIAKRWKYITKWVRVY